MMAAIVQDVTKTFQEGKEIVQVLRGVPLSIEPGEVVSLEGPSGSGKTTLLTFYLATCLEVRNSVWRSRALIASPAVLLADEPTANVDSRTGQMILDIFRTLAKRDKRDLLFVTHDPQVRTVTDRVLTIRDGLLTA